LAADSRVLKGAGHGGKESYIGKSRDIVPAFLKDQFK